MSSAKMRCSFLLYRLHVKYRLIGRKKTLAKCEQMEAPVHTMALLKMTGFIGAGRGTVGTKRVVGEVLGGNGVTGNRGSRIASVGW